MYEKMKKQKDEMNKYESDSESSEGPNEDDLEHDLFKKVLKNGVQKQPPQIGSEVI